MLLRRLKAEGLAQNTYFIASGGEAAVIDPRREKSDLRECLELARANCAIVRYVFETHRNEDFVHGSLELQTQTRAKILHGAGIPFKYGEAMRDGEEVSIGTLRIQALETPGHTPESLSFVLFDQKAPAEPLAVFTGDTLFVSSTGRIDLPGADQKRENAGKLYDSIHGKILPLGDQVLLCPAHGAGSVCGSGMGDRDWSTLGYEKRTNPHLRLGRAEFIDYKVGEKFVRPPYFRRMEQANLNGPPPLAGRPEPAPLNVTAFRDATAGKGAVIVDTRLPQAFGGGHLPGSYNIWLEGMALYPGWMFDYDTDLFLVPYSDEEVPVADRLLCRIGFDRVPGYLCGGFEKWQNAAMPIEFTGELPVDALRPLIDTSNLCVLDVREPREWQSGVVPGAMLLYVGDLKDHLQDVPRDRLVAVMCSVGHRGSLAASILQRAGFTQVYNVPGGFTAWAAKGYPVKPPR